MMLERFAPADAIAHAEYAEQLGFSGTVSTDHFQPWLSRHGQATFVWSVLGALGARTAGELGAGAVTAGARMHPAAIAQASATIAELMESVQSNLRRGRALGLRASQAMLDSYSTLVSGVLIGMSDALQQGGAAVAAGPSRRK